MFSFLLNHPEHGALPLLYGAPQDVPGNSDIGPDGAGSIKGNPKVRRPSKTARDPETALKLWGLTARLTGVGAVEQREFGPTV